MVCGQDTAMETETHLEDFQLPDPEPLAPGAHQLLISSAISRISATGVKADSSAASHEGRLWLSLLTRFVTRGLPAEATETAAVLASVRQLLFNYVVQDPSGRCENTSLL